MILAKSSSKYSSNLIKFKSQKLFLEVEISEDVYNGKRKIFSQNEMFMTTQNIIKCFDSIKNKNSEGFDGIHQRILVDSLEDLLEMLTKLFN